MISPTVFVSHRLRPHVYYFSPQILFNEPSGKHSGPRHFQHLDSTGIFMHGKIPTLKISLIQIFCVHLW